MKIDGEYTISASKKAVWRCLNDPDILRDAIPGCKSFTKKADDNFEAVVEQKIGPVKYSFNVEVFIRNAIEEESYRIEGTGKGGLAGFAKGGADVNLLDIDGKTNLKYNADVTIGGKIAQLGSRLLSSFSKKMAKKFFDKFTSLVKE